MCCMNIGADCVAAAETAKLSTDRDDQALLVNRAKVSEKTVDDAGNRRVVVESAGLRK